MNLAICSLASGSSGNCYLVKSNNTSILVDAGLSAKQISERLLCCGVRLEDLSAVLLTHEHSDHTQGIKVLLKSENIKLYTNRKTFSGTNLNLNENQVVIVKTGETFQIGDLTVSSFQNSHDAADPMGFSISANNKTITIVTDTGFVTEEAYNNMKLADILILESNHDENILKMGRYPWFLKQRILGDKGHLSNDAAAEILQRLYKEGVWKQDLGSAAHQVLLAHLSLENNFPEMAQTTVSNILEADGVDVGRSVKLFTLSRTEPSPLFEA